ncbi:hypothetical protein DYB36_012902, partial [Aphanomyces astaci]
ALPPRSQHSNAAAAPVSAPTHAQPVPHPPLKKSSSFSMDSKSHVVADKPDSPDTATSTSISKAKTPPTSQKKSGWGFPSLSLPSLGIVDMLRRGADPVGDATVAKVGRDMEAYFCQEKKRWVFPGEEATDDAAGPPSAPPTSFAAAAPSSSASSAPDDPLAALMAPPPMKETTPLAAMMAPPARSMYGSQRGGAPAVKRAPARPQYAVFKPSPAAVSSVSDDPPGSANDNSSLPPPPGSSGGQ